MKNLKKIINEEGFLFGKFKPDLDIKKEVLSTDSPNQNIYNFFEKVIINYGFIVGDLLMVYEDITLGKFHEMHTHLVPADFQVVVWFPEDDFEGRAFVYGKRDNLNKFYPKFGDMCFMKTNDLDFIHGVEPLLTDTLVRTLLISVNYKGDPKDHLTVSSEDFRAI